MTDPLREKLRTLAGEIRACESQYQWIALRIATILDAEGQDETAEFGSGVCAHNVGDAGPCRCVLPRGHSGLHICECEQHAAPSVSPGEDEGVGTGAGEGAPRQDTGSAWVTRSADCPEDPAQAHPLFFLTARLTDDDVVEAGARAIAEVSESEGGGYWHPDTAWYWKKRARAALAAAAAVIGGER